MSKRTPYPWKVTDCVLWSVVSNGQSKVAQCDNLADAHLIAAAPELLQAAKDVLKALEQGQKQWSFNGPMLRKAIAKAEGK